MNTYSFPWRSLIWVTIFTIAMGFLESAVVVYMRALLYPHGFNFPMVPIPQNLVVTEILREAATLIMLIGIGVLAGKNKISRFAWFIYAFAIWDIFYYVFLKMLINWPESFMTWDILFMIPTVWIGPVIAPVIISLNMIFLGVIIVFFDSGKRKANPNVREWVLLIAGSIVLVVAFIWDYSSFLFKYYGVTQLWSVSSTDILKLSSHYSPVKFNWFLFILAELIILTGIGHYWKRNFSVSKGR